MNEKADKYGPETPNYQLLNEAERQQKHTVRKPRKVKSGNKGQPLTGADKPK